MQWGRMEPTLRLKVQGGTPINGDHSLCDSCRHSRIVRGRSLDEELVFCDASPMRTAVVSFKVTSCSDYDDRKLPSYWELMQTAWILQPGAGKRPAGFVRASDLQEEEFIRSVRRLRKHNER